MELYLDTADVAQVERLMRVLPLQGVTTNPSIIAAAKQPIWEVLSQLRTAIGAQGRLFAQVLGRDAEVMIDEARRLTQRVNGVIVKVPVTAQGLTAIKQLATENIPTLGTAVYSATQGLLAALAGAQYVAPYVNRVDAQGSDGVRMVEELNHLLACHAPHCKVLAASFKTPRQALDCLRVGCEAITLPIDIAQQMLASPAVDSAIAKFEQDWQTAFGNLSL